MCYGVSWGMVLHSVAMEISLVLLRVTGVLAPICARPCCSLGLLSGCCCAAQARATLEHLLELEIAEKEKAIAVVRWAACLTARGSAQQELLLTCKTPNQGVPNIGRCWLAYVLELELRPVRLSVAMQATSHGSSEEAAAVGRAAGNFGQLTPKPIELDPIRSFA